MGGALAAENVRHAIGKAIVFETDPRWPLPSSDEPGSHLCFELPRTNGGRFELLALAAQDHAPEDYLLVHAAAVRSQLGIPILELDLVEHELPSGKRALRVEFDVASTTWRIELIAGRHEWLLATCVLPRARFEQLVRHFDMLLDEVTFGVPSLEGVR